MKRSAVKNRVVCLLSKTINSSRYRLELDWYSDRPLYWITRWSWPFYGMGHRVYSGISRSEALHAWSEWMKAEQSETICVGL